MTFRVAMPTTAFSLTPTRTKAGKERPYLEWLHGLPCVITGVSPVEAAHLSSASAFYGHTGRGKGQKADDRWALPMSPEKHREQHAGSEMAFWREHGINPHLLALVLHSIWEQGASEAYAAVVIGQHRIGTSRGEDNG